MPISSCPSSLISELYFSLSSQIFSSDIVQLLIYVRDSRINWDGRVTQFREKMQRRSFAQQCLILIESMRLQLIYLMHVRATKTFDNVSLASLSLSFDVAIWFSMQCRALENEAPDSSSLNREVHQLRSRDFIEILNCLTLTLVKLLQR